MMPTTIQQNHPPKPIVPRAFTLIELAFAMVVFSLTLSGLFPLLIYLSRDLQPVKKVAADGTVTYRSKTPARDGNITGVDITPAPNYIQHVWYITPSNDPWVRKLEAGAQLYPAATTDSAPTQFTSAASPIPIVATSLQQDDDFDADNGFVDTGTVAWTYNPTGVTGALGDDSHRHEALAYGSTPTAVATWTFTIPVAGWYSVQATWPAAADQVDDAVFVVSLNGVTLMPPNVVASVNQTAAPNDLTDENSQPWKQLNTSPLQLAKDDIVLVQLTDVRGSSTELAKFVVADGVRIVQNEVKIVSIERSPSGANSNSNNADVTARVAVTVNFHQ